MNILPHPKELEPFLAEAEAIVADCDRADLNVKMIFSRREAAYQLQFSSCLDDRHFSATGPRAIDLVDAFRRAYRLPPKPKTASERIADLEAEIARIRAEEVASV